MGRKIDPIERELNEIRLRIYERTKDMTREERTEYFNKSGEAFAKEYGVKMIANANDV